MLRVSECHFHRRVMVKVLKDEVLPGNGESSERTSDLREEEHADVVVPEGSIKPDSNPVDNGLKSRLRSRKVLKYPKYRLRSMYHGCLKKGIFYHN